MAKRGKHKKKKLKMTKKAIASRRYYRKHCKGKKRRGGSRKK